MTPNPARFVEDQTWKVTLECLAPLSSCVDIRFVWVGSAQNCNHDQIMDEIEVGPFSVGTNEFEVEISAPNVDEIPKQEILQPTVMQILFGYKGQEFLKVGYYVNVAYFREDMNSNPPMKADLEWLGKSILVMRPAITASDINWGDTGEEDEELSPE